MGFVGCFWRDQGLFCSPKSPPPSPQILAGLTIAVVVDNVSKQKKTLWPFWIWKFVRVQRIFVIEHSSNRKQPKIWNNFVPSDLQMNIYLRVWSAHRSMSSLRCSSRAEESEAAGTQLQLSMCSLHDDKPVHSTNPKLKKKWNSSQIVSTVEVIV